MFYEAFIIFMYIFGLVIMYKYCSLIYLTRVKFRNPYIIYIFQVNIIVFQQLFKIKIERFRKVIRMN